MENVVRVVRVLERSVCGGLFERVFGIVAREEVVEVGRVYKARLCARSENMRVA